MHEVGKAQTRKSFTEYSMKDKYEVNGVKTTYPFGQAYNNNLIPNDGVLSEKINYESQRTPMFTEGIAQQNFYFRNQVPPLSFEPVTERIGTGQKEEKNSHDSIYYRYPNSLNNEDNIQFSNKEIKGSPRDSMYFEDSSEHESYKRNYVERNPQNPSMGGNTPYYYPPQYQYGPQMYPNYAYPPQDYACGQMQNYGYYPQMGKEKMTKQKNDFILGYTPAENHSDMNVQMMKVFSQTFQNMQEYQSKQFECMLKSHTKLMGKIIDRLPDESQDYSSRSR
jgi:hypothetical protein